jgi:hypothetical protein
MLSLDKEYYDEDRFVSLVIINGIITYGWSYNELTATSSDLTDFLRQYIDLDYLAHYINNYLGLLLGIREVSDGSEIELLYNPASNKAKPFDNMEIVAFIQQVLIYSGLDIATFIQNA